MSVQTLPKIEVSQDEYNKGETAKQIVRGSADSVYTAITRAMSRGGWQKLPVQTQWTALISQGVPNTYVEQFKAQGYTPEQVLRYLQPMKVTSPAEPQMQQKPTINTTVPQAPVSTASVLKSGNSSKKVVTIPDSNYLAYIDENGQPAWDFSELDKESIRALIEGEQAINTQKPVSEVQYTTNNPKKIRSSSSTTNQVDNSQPSAPAASSHSTPSPTKKDVTTSSYPPEPDYAYKTREWDFTPYVYKADTKNIYKGISPELAHYIINNAKKGEKREERVAFNQPLANLPYNTLSDTLTYSVKELGGDKYLVLDSENKAITRLPQYMTTQEVTTSGYGYRNNKLEDLTDVIGIRNTGQEYPTYNSQPVVIINNKGDVKKYPTISSLYYDPKASNEAKSGFEPVSTVKEIGRGLKTIGKSFVSDVKNLFKQSGGTLNYFDYFK